MDKDTTAIKKKPHTAYFFPKVIGVLHCRVLCPVCPLTLPGLDLLGRLLLWVLRLVIHGILSGSGCAQANNWSLLTRSSSERISATAQRASSRLSMANLSEALRSKPQESTLGCSILTFTSPCHACTFGWFCHSWISCPVHIL